MGFCLHSDSVPEQDAHDQTQPTVHKKKAQYQYVLGL